MSNHTPEPWSLLEAGDSIKHQVPVSSDRTSILTIATEGAIAFGAVYSADDARRIVACVNACEGMETEHLENQSMLGETLLDRFNLLKIEAGKLTKQRDELLEALEAFSNYIHAEQCSTDGPVHYSDGQLTALAVMARKAIAKAKGCAA